MENIGDVSWRAKRNPIFSAGGYDLDTAQVPWQGAESGKTAFVDGLASFAALPGYPKMYLMRWPEDDDAHFPTVTLEYRGCKNGSAPPVKGEDGRSLQSLSVSVESTTFYTGERTDGGTEGTTVTVQMDIEYYASQTTYTWFSLTTPADTPIYATARRVVDLSTTVFSRTYKITQTDNAIDAPTGSVASVDTGTYTQLNNALVPGHKVQDYKIEDLVPSSLWACTSVVNYQYTPIGV